MDFTIGLLVGAMVTAILWAIVTDLAYFFDGDDDEDDDWNDPEPFHYY